MGFFSKDCHECGHPLLSIYSVSGINDWMIPKIHGAPR